MQDFSIDITKATLRWQQYNSMVANNWCLVNVKVFNQDRTRYRKFKAVILIDSDDLYEHYYDEDLSEIENEERGYTKSEILAMARELAYNSFEGLIKSYNDYKEALAWCNETIERYNRCCK